MEELVWRVEDGDPMARKLASVDRNTLLQNLKQLDAEEIYYKIE